MAVCMTIGALIGAFYANHFGGNRLNIINSGSNKLNNILNVIDDQYVDKVNADSLIESAIPTILQELDPHTTYIKAKDVELAEAELKGSFFGIGIEFNIKDDTVRIIKVIPNGPAEKSGIQAGDKIVMANDKPFVGKKLVTNQNVMKTFRGPKSTRIRIGVIRYGKKQIRQFIITRAEIPKKSITATYMIDSKTGYIKINSFAETTYPELLISLAKLSEKGFKNLVIDLRDNTGGYLQSAVQIANEFLPKNKLILFTQGRKYPREEYRSDGNGSYQHIPLIILTNENSASSSEILAGAMQDHDRATIIGRRSFGKGLVQQQIAFKDKSLIRLTIARYYTPSGRCIQKPYTKGDNGDYQKEILDRYVHGEFFNKDSIKHQGPQYHTTGGRVVYGGGGITPDIFIPEDTLNVTSYLQEVIMSGIVQDFAFDFINSHSKELQACRTLNELTAYMDKHDVVEQFVVYADRRKYKRRNLLIKKSYTLLKKHIYSRILYVIKDEDTLIRYSNEDDPYIKKSIEIINQKKAFPQLNKQQTAPQTA